MKVFLVARPDDPNADDQEEMRQKLEPDAQKYLSAHLKGGTPNASRAVLHVLLEHWLLAHGRKVRFELEVDGLAVIGQSEPALPANATVLDIGILRRAATDKLEFPMPIRWDKFTVKAQEAVQRANNLASEHGNPELLPVHLLAALLEDKEGIVSPVLEKIGIGPQAVLSDLYREIEKLPKVSGEAAQATLSNATNKLLEQAFKEASNFKDEYVSTEHLLLAITHLKQDAAQQVLCPSRRHQRRDSQSPDRRPRLAKSNRPES